MEGIIVAVAMNSKLMEHNAYSRSKLSRCYEMNMFKHFDPRFVLMEEEQMITTYTAFTTYYLKYCRKCV